MMPNWQPTGRTRFRCHRDRRRWRQADGPALLVLQIEERGRVEYFGDCPDDYTTREETRWRDATIMDIPVEARIVTANVGME